MNLHLKSDAELMAVWNALQQFIDNNDPDELVCSPAERPAGLEAEHAAAKRLCEMFDAHFAARAE